MSTSDTILRGKKILIVGTIASSILGFRRPLIKKLVDEGYNVFAMAIDYTDEDRLKVKELGAFPIDYKLDRFSVNPLTNLIDTSGLCFQIRSIKPDIVFSYFAKPVVFGTLAAKCAGVPQIYGMLEGLGTAFTKRSSKDSFKTKIIRLLQVFLFRVSFRVLDRLVVLNEDDRDELLNIHHLKVKDCTVLGGIGVPKEQFTTRADHKNEGFVFLFVGRLIRDKGIFELIEAAEKITSKYSQAKVFIVGSLDDQNPNSLREEDLSRISRNKAIKFWGQVQDVTALYHQSNVFVLPSYREGVPRSTQEAMMCGLPVITTDVPGCRQTVVNDENGFIVEPFSSNAIYDAMEKFIKEPDLASRMGQKSRQLAEELYDEKKTTNKLMEILNL